MNKRLALSQLVLLLLVWGCRLGGSSLVDFSYSTVWSGPNQSQIIRLTPSSGGAALVRVLNSPLTELQLPRLPSGSYELSVGLYDGPNGGGNLVGALGDLITITVSTASYRTAAVRTAARVEIRPPSAKVEMHETVQFFAVARDSAGVSLLLMPGAIMWQSSTVNATVDQNGIATGVSPGPAQIEAHFKSFVAGADLTVVPFVTSHSKWTVMVFMNGSNNRDSHADTTVNQLEQVAGNPQVRFVIQWKRPSWGTRRYLARADSSSAIRSDLVQDMGAGVDMGSALTLHDFIGWSQNYYPADNYILIVWNRGGGWLDGVSYDEEFGTHIETWQLTGALEAPQAMDIVAWDADFMQMLEVAYQIKDRCAYVVGSEEAMPGDGFPYQLVFRRLHANANLGVESTAAEFGTSMLHFYGNTSRIECSAIKCSKLPDLAIAADGLATQLVGHQGLIDARVIQARAQAQSYGTKGAYRDLFHVATILRDLIPEHNEIVAAASGVREQLQLAVISEVHGSQSPNSHGVSIEFGSHTSPYLSQYSKLAFANDTSWDDWLAIAP